jgi:hypothetical protein
MRKILIDFHSGTRNDENGGRYDLFYVDLQSLQWEV